MKDITCTTEEMKMAAYAKALAHPTRIAILKYLASLDCCYFGAINDVFSLSKATVSQHLKELKNAGLIQGTIEYPKVRYCIKPKNWAEAKKLFGGFFAQGCCKSFECKE